MQRFMMISAILLGLIVGCFVAGMQHFAHMIRMDAGIDHASANLGLTKAETGIVVVTGSGGRIEAGLMLLLSDRGGRMLISGIGEGVSKQDILRVAAPQVSTAPDRLEALMSCCIDLGPAARNTRGNADETRRWSDDHALSQIILVTADFHIPRTLIEFRRQMPGRHVIPHAVPTKGLGIDQNGITQWWQSGVRLLTVAREYGKYLASLVG